MRLLLLTILLIGGCGGRGQYYQRQTAGHVGCARSEIRISDEGKETLADTMAGQQTWTATCRGKTYYCVRNTESHSLSTDSGQRGTQCRVAD